MSHSTFDVEAGFATMSDGGELAYEVTGSSQSRFPILLIRPLGGSMNLWGKFRDALARERRVISFDLRGSGRSTEDRGWVTTRGIARQGLRLLDHLAIARAHVFGLSLGGMAATWLAILAPLRVAGLAIASAPARGLELSHSGLGREINLALCLAKSRGNVEPSLVHRILSERFRKEYPEEMRRIELEVHRTPATRTSLVRHAAAGLMHDARSDLHHILAPTLVLAGGDDALAGTEGPRHLAEHIKGAIFEIISGSGHDLTLEKPIETAARVNRFFTSVEAPSSVLPTDLHAQRI